MIELPTRQIALRDRPDQRLGTRQVWSDLTFLHWAMEPEVIQPLLPPGLTVETFEGQAYVGLVPFVIQELKHSLLPLMRFCETNVRTYVIGPDGEPGVWFFSLDAASLAAVVGARAWFGLPYFWASMQVKREDIYVSYGSRRRSAPRRSGRHSLVVKQTGIPEAAKPGTLEFFLVERYLLYAVRGGRLVSGRVHHAPYKIAPAKVVMRMDTLLTDAGLPPQMGEPLAHWADPVQVESFVPQPIKTAR